MKRLKDKHLGETCWIVGKGKSLRNLKRGDIGDGPVIAIYEAIIPVEHLLFPNELYCLEKDGGQLKREPLSPNPECDIRDCDNCMGVVLPRRASVLLHDAEARYCFLDYPRRYVFTLEEIGLEKNEFSLVCAIKIAEFMGCKKLMFVSCDAHAIGDNRNCLPLFDQSYYDWIYELQRSILPKYLIGKDYEWVTPSV